MTPAEREAKWALWPNGDAGDAIDFALDHTDSSFEMYDFLECWREGRLCQWPAYHRWLQVQRDGARAAKSDDIGGMEEEMTLVNRPQGTGEFWAGAAQREKLQAERIEALEAALRSARARVQGLYDNDNMAPGVRNFALDTIQAIDAALNQSMEEKDG